MTWDCSIADEIGEMFEDYSWRFDEMDAALEKLALHHREQRRLRRTIHEKCADCSGLALAGKSRCAPCGERNAARTKIWVVQNLVAVRPVWRDRKRALRARETAKPVRVHRCRCCGEVGHNARGCTRKRAA